MRTKAEPLRNISFVDRVKAILETRNLTLHQVSRRSAELYGRSSRDFLPHNLYHDLRRGSFSPALHQFCALSRISGYDLMGWLRVFGFAPERILELQVALSSKRTILLDPSLDNHDSWVLSFRDFIGNSLPAGITPLALLLELSPHRRPQSSTTSADRNFLYAKIGYQDAIAFPELFPGSIVRIDPQISEGLLTGEKGGTLDKVFLIEHSKGYWCCRIHISGRNRIVPIKNQLPYAHVEFRVPNEARILGMVDMEVRRIHNIVEPNVPKELADTWEPVRIDRRDEGLGSLVRRMRGQAAVSFREASAMSRRIADLLGDERYFASPGSLSDYEAQDDPPRHFHKVITLCSLYGIRFADFVAAAGINLGEMGRDPIPSRIITSVDLAAVDGESASSESVANNPTLTRLMMQFEELPLFLQGSFEALAGMKELSFRDFFWIGTQSSLPHPSLRGALLVIVNRHKKKPPHSLTLQQWRQSLYMLVRRDGTYLCAACTLEDGILVVHANPLGFHQPERLRNRNDAEVVGEIAAIAKIFP